MSTPDRTKRTGTLPIPLGSGYGDYLGTDSYAFEVTGNELSPKICAGDTIIVDPSKAVKAGGFVVVWSADAEGTPTLHYLAGTAKVQIRPNPALPCMPLWRSAGNCRTRASGCP
jgi:peptidase S24-like protein